MGILKGGNRPNPLLLVVGFFLFISLVGTWDLLVKRGYGEQLASAVSQVTNPDYDGSSVTDADIQLQPPQGTDPYPWDTPQDGAPAQPPTPPPIKIDQFTAVITETHVSRVPNLVPIIVHFAAVLGPTWPITFVTLEETWLNWTAPPPMQRLVDTGQVRIMYLPPGTEFPSHESVSVFLSGVWLWEQFVTYKRILMFQVDSILCANSQRRPEDFLEFDLIGAPIKPGIGTGMNGGLSLRNPQLMLAIAKDLEERVATDPNAASEVNYEDQWFYRRVRELGGLVPEPEIAGLFSVETLYFEEPMGFHQVLKFQGAHREDIEKYCPEVGMIGKGSHFR